MGRESDNKRVISERNFGVHRKYKSLCRKMHVNGLLIKSSEGTPNNDWTMVASIILFLVLSYLSAYFFKKQVIKNA